MFHPKFSFTFQAEVWQYAGQGGWFFVSLPLDTSAEIRSMLGWQEEGWGRLKAEASTGGHDWKTAIWYDTKLQTYLLPLKAEIRKKTGVKRGDRIEVLIRL